MADLNFNEFEEISEKAWKQKIQVDLKGKDYNDSMITHTEEGIDIKPFYHKDSNTDVNVPNPSQWYISKHISGIDSFNWEKDIEAGIESFYIHHDNFDEINTTILPDVPIIFKCKTGDFKSFKSTSNRLLAFDPILHLAKTGNWINAQKQDLEHHKTYVNSTDTIAFDMSLYHNAGGSVVQQLGYGVAHLASYFKNLDFKEGQKLNVIVSNAVGTNYFFEIAKIKALKVLINSLCKAEKINHSTTVVSTPGLIDYSIYDYNVNMLRSTSMSMSAIIGGSDFICNLPYDAVFKNQNEFSQRIAKNQLLILKHESYFDKVENPTDGSYYINSLTTSLAEKALNLFKSIEKSGGFIQQLFDGKIQTKLEEQFSNSLKKVELKEKVILGVNKYPNEEEQLSASIEKPIQALKEKRKTLIKPILAKRFSSKIENQRLNSEQHKD